MAPALPRVTGQGRDGGGACHAAAAHAGRGTTPGGCHDGGCAARPFPVSTTTDAHLSQWYLESGLALARLDSSSLPPPNRPTPTPTSTPTSTPTANPIHTPPHPHPQCSQCVVPRVAAVISAHPGAERTVSNAVSCLQLLGRQLPLSCASLDLLAPTAPIVSAHNAPHWQLLLGILTVTSVSVAGCGTVCIKLGYDTRYSKGILWHQ